MSDSKFATILLLTCNRSKYLPECLSSIRKQTYKFWRLVVSDCSDDPVESQESQTILQEHQYLQPDNELVLLRQPHRIPQADHLALVIKEVSTPYFALIDDDDFWAPNHLERSLKWLSDDESHGIAASNGFVVNEESRILDMTNAQDMQLPSSAETKKWFYLMLRTFYGSTSGYVFRTEAIQYHKFYNTSCVDIHLAISVLLNNFKMKGFQEPSYFYRVHNASNYKKGIQVFIDRHYLHLYLLKTQGYKIVIKYPFSIFLFLKSIIYLAKDKTSNIY